MFPSLESLLQVSIPNLSFFLLQIFNGLVLGVIFVLISLGLSITFGTMGIVNFAHGEFLLIGAYLAWAAATVSGSLLVGIVVATVGVATFAILVERVTLQPTYGEDPLLQLLLTFGLAVAIREAVQIVWGRSGKRFPVPEWGITQIDLMVFNYPLYRLTVIIAGALITLGVYLFLTQSDTGLVIRAGVQDREMTEILGINISWTFILVFALGGALAGVAGALIAPIRGVYPLLGVELLIPAFVVVVIGGMGSFKGSVLAALLVGQVIVLTGMVASAFSGVVIYLLMAAVLLARPQGLFGTGEVFD